MPPKKGKKKISSSASSSGSAEGALVQLKPSQILYTYGKLLPYFSGCGRTLQGTLDQIVRGEMTAADLPAIAVISAEVSVGADKAGGDKEHGGGDDDGWSSEEEGRGKRGKARRRGGGGGGASGNAKRAPEKETRFFSTNNRRLWVLKQCEERGMLGPEGTIGVRLQRPDVAKRMVEKGTRSFRIERATDKVKILDVEPPRKVHGEFAPPGDDDDEDDDEGENSADERPPPETKEVEEITEAMEEFHPVLRPYR